MTEPITTSTIINTLKGWVESKTPIGPETWVDAGLKMNILRGEEDDKLFDLMQLVARMKAQHIINGDSVAKAQAHIETTDEYRHMLKQKAYIEQIEEMIRLAKARARLKSEEYHYGQ